MIKILVVEFNDLCEDDINRFLENVPVSPKPHTGNNEGKRKVTPWVYYSNITLGELQRMIEYIEDEKLDDIDLRLGWLRNRAALN
jgi:spore germination protein YaaH